nr:MAG TPA: replicative helicase [Caudoviricetes sp.]
MATTIGQVIAARTRSQDLKTIQEKDFKIRVREGRLRELLTQSFKKMVYEQSGKKDSVTTEQERFIAQMANWMSVDSVDRHRWVMMIGGVGNGKTTMLKAMHYLIHWMSTTEGGRYFEAVRHSYCYMTATELCELYKDDRAEFNAIKNRRLFFLDDIGTEPQTQMDYGNEQHPVKEFLMYRYNRQLPLIMTTNLPKAARGEKSPFEARYTLQVSDRLNEMCTSLVFSDKSFR